MTGLWTHLRCSHPSALLMSVKWATTHSVFVDLRASLPHVRYCNHGRYWYQSDTCGMVQASITKATVSLLSDVIYITLSWAIIVLGFFFFGCLIPKFLPVSDNYQSQLSDQVIPRKYQRPPGYFYRPYRGCFPSIKTYTNASRLNPPSTHRCLRPLHIIVFPSE